MERFPVELLFVLGFILFALFNYFTQRAAQRRQQEEPAQAQPEEEEVLEDLWGRTPAPPPAPASAPAPVLAPRAPAAPLAAPAARRSTHPVRALLQDRRDLRRAVALMMVLGPCRALEPPER